MLSPELCTVSIPELLFSIRKLCPVVSVEATGNTTVCVVDPVNACIPVLATVSVVVPAAVAVVVNQGMKFTHLLIPSPVTLNVVLPAPLSPSITVSVSAPLPLFIDIAPRVASVSISGERLLS